MNFNMINQIVPDTMQSFAADLIKGLQKKKEAIIKEALIKVGRLGLWEETLEDKRFKKIAMEIDKDGNEYYYLDDGSKDGVLFLTILVSKPEIIFQDNKYSMIINLSYQ